MAGGARDLRVFRNERNRKMLLATFQDLMGQAFVVIVGCVCVYGWLINKFLAKNPGVKKAAGAKVLGMIVNWLK
jgi:hypothetical protein